MGCTYSLSAKENISACGRGFHACKHVVDCYNPGFGYTHGDVMLEVTLGGVVKTAGAKSCGSKIHVVRVVTGVVGGCLFDEEGMVACLRTTRACCTGRTISLLRYDQMVQ